VKHGWLRMALTTNEWDSVIIASYGPELLMRCKWRFCNAANSAENATSAALWR
jgi:hypothetical protein